MEQTPRTMNILVLSLVLVLRRTRQVHFKFNIINKCYNYYNLWVLNGMGKRFDEVNSTNGDSAKILSEKWASWFLEKKTREKKTTLKTDKRHWYYEQPIYNRSCVCVYTINLYAVKIVFVFGQWNESRSEVCFFVERNRLIVLLLN